MANEQALKLTVDGKEYEVVVGDLSHAPVRVLVNGRAFFVKIVPDQLTSGSDRRVIAEESRSAQAFDAPSATSAPASASSIPTEVDIVAPMPGSIVNIRVKPGQRVESGDILCYLEAMKMNNAIHAPSAGVIKHVAVSEGQVVVHRQVLVTYAD